LESPQEIEAQLLLKKLDSERTLVSVASGKGFYSIELILFVVGLAILFISGIDEMKFGHHPSVFVVFAMMNLFMMAFHTRTQRQLNAVIALLKKQQKDL